MNPVHLAASELMIWGLVLHLIADWPLQNDWMAKNKVNMWHHPAGCVHAGIHGCLLALVFGWAAIPIAMSHLLIDTRKPVIWWSKLIGQTQPSGKEGVSWVDHNPLPVVDVRMEVRFWTDQVFHIAMIAIASVVVSL